MIPISHFVHVIQAERERDLARWQRSHAADLSEQPASGDQPRSARGGSPAVAGPDR